MLDEVKRISKHENTEYLFLLEMQKVFGVNTVDYRNIQTAVALVHEAFKGRKRLNGEPYVTHLESVAQLVFDHGVRIGDVIVAALLHDLVEDIPGWYFFRIWHVFNFRVALYVFFVTKLSSHTHIPRNIRRGIFYFLLLHGPRYARVIKLCDRIHNLLTLESVEPWKKQRTLIETEEKYIKLAHSVAAQFPRLETELRSAIAEGKKQLLSN